jgi:hypothetical protein
VKLSAYVPDGLWARVRGRFPGARPSPTTQLALRRLADRPAPGADARQRAYDEGYEAGLALCEGLDWAAVERLATSNWPIDEPAPGDEVARRSGMRDALRDVWQGVVRAVDGRA